MGAPVARAVLLGGGEIRDYGRVASLILPGDFIACADSGYGHCKDLGVTPRLLVGDFDSIRETPPEDIPRLPFPAEKKHTDTALALEELLARGYRSLLLAGMLGGRLDHTLGNLQSLAGLSAAGVEALMTDGLTDAYAVTDGQLILPRRERCYFSLLCYSEACRGVFIRGARYSLHDHTLRFHTPRAISNEFLDGPAHISVREGTLVALVVPMDTFSF